MELAIARRYARALLELGKTSEERFAFLSQMEAFVRALNDVPSLLSTLKNRYIDLNARLKVVSELGAKMGFSEYVTNTIKVILEKGRFFIIFELVNSLRAQVFEAENHTDAIAITAQALKPSVKDELTNVLSRKTNKTVHLENIIKPEVLGGISVVIDGKVYDGTIKTQLDKMVSEMVGL